MMTQKMTENQARHVAAFVNELRPDFGIPGIMAALEKALDRGSADELAVAMIRVAGSPKARTPMVVTMDGPHWTGGDQAPATSVDRRPDSNDQSPDCVNHPGVKEWECKDCARFSPPPSNFADMVAAAKAEKRTGQNTAGVAA